MGSGDRYGILPNNIGAGKLVPESLPVPFTGQPQQIDDWIHGAEQPQEQAESHARSRRLVASMINNSRTSHPQASRTKARRFEHDEIEKRKDRPGKDRFSIRIALRVDRGVPQQTREWPRRCDNDSVDNDDDYTTNQPDIIMFGVQHASTDCSRPDIHSNLSIWSRVIRKNHPRIACCSVATLLCPSLRALAGRGRCRRKERRRLRPANSGSSTASVADSSHNARLRLGCRGLRPGKTPDGPGSG